MVIYWLYSVKYCRFTSTLDSNTVKIGNNHQKTCFPQNALNFLSVYRAKLSWFFNVLWKLKANFLFSRFRFLYVTLFNSFAVLTFELLTIIYLIMTMAFAIDHPIRRPRLNTGKVQVPQYDVKIVAGRRIVIFHQVFKISQVHGQSIILQFWPLEHCKCQNND